MHRLLICLLLTGLLAAAGCSKTPVKTFVKTDLIQASYDLADTLEKNLMYPLAKDQAILVSSFVNVDNLQESSPLGRMMAEYVASRLSQKGYSVVELKLRQDTLFIKEKTGELLLSRDIKVISRENNAPIVVVGTYTGGYDKVYVSTRMVRTDDSIIASSADYSLPMDWKQRNYMLKKNYLDPNLQNPSFPADAQTD